MSRDGAFEIFLMAAPGLEKALWAEARALGFKSARYVPGGVTMKGGWPDVWRANLEIRGAGRVTATLGSFHAGHLSELDKRARRFDWGRTLRTDVPFRVEAACKASRIYHSGAAAERIERAISASLGARPSPEADVVIRARIENDLVTLGVDTSGGLLHKRGHRQAVAKAPIRETMAALLLRQCGYDGREPVLDPMCGSGTFVIEAAEIAMGLKPGRSRRFAFEQLATFDPAAWAAMRSEPVVPLTTDPAICFRGSDRDAGAIEMASANAERAGVAAITRFETCDLVDLAAPEGPPGLVILNPPYGTRIGDKRRLTDLYRSIGITLKARCRGWRVGLVTTDPALARATGLPFAPPGPPIAHGGLRVTLYATGAL